MRALQLRAWGLGLAVQRGPYNSPVFRIVAFTLSLGIAAVALAAFYVWASSWTDDMRALRYLQAALAFHLLVAVLPSLERASADDATVERRLSRLTIDSLPVGLYVVDRDYRIVLWNRKRETGTQGLRREEVLGRTAFEVLSRQPAAALAETEKSH